MSRLLEDTRVGDIYHILQILPMCDIDAESGTKNFRICIARDTAVSFRKENKFYYKVVAKYKLEK